MIATTVAAALAATFCSLAHAQGDPPKMEPTEAVKRDGLGSFFSKIKPGAELTVAYFGASVTNGAGASSNDTKWRWLVHHWLEAEYPNTRFVHSHVVNGGTGAHLGASRLKREVLDHDPALVFIEFSVNDGGQPYEECIKTMEGLVRQTWRHDPTTDIIILHVINTGALKSYEQGELPSTATAFETVAEHYGVPTINVAWVAAQQLMAGGFTWEEFSIDSVHPRDLGYKVYADHIIACLTDWREGALADPHALPEPLREGNWEDGGMVHPNQCVLSAGWRPETDPQFQHYPHFPDLLVADRPGESLKFRLRGTHFGLYHIVGKDSGIVEVVVDGQPTGKHDLWDKYCEGGWRSAFRMLGGDLEPGEHEVEVRILPERNEKSLGHAVRLGFVTYKGEFLPIDQ